MKRILRDAALPAAIGTVLVALGRPIGWVALGAGFFRLQLAVIAPDLDAAASRAFVRGVGLVERGLIAVLLLIPALLTVAAWLATKVFRLDSLDHGASGWTVVGGDGRAHGSPAAQWSEQERPSRTPSAPWLRRSFRVLLAVSILGAATWAIRNRVVHPPTSTAKAPGGDIPAAVANQADIEQIWQEEGAVFAHYEPDPVVGWRLPASADGEVVTVEDHRRVTVQVSDDGPVVWLFGGSTAFGSNQSDGRTIASDLARAAAEQGAPIQVVNWGRHAYTSYQEAQLLGQALDHTDDPPDLVIFYDGYNDVAVGLGSTFLVARGDLPPRAPTIVAGGAPAPKQRPISWQDADERYDTVVADYRRASALAADEVRHRNIEVVHAWQPSAFTRTPTPGELVQLRARGLDDHAFRTLAHAHEEIRRRLPSTVIDLADVLDHAPTVFLDQVHTNEVGAQLVADRLAQELGPRLRALRP